MKFKILSVMLSLLFQFAKADQCTNQRSAIKSYWDQCQYYIDRAPAIWPVKSSVQQISPTTSVINCNDWDTPHGGYSINYLSPGFNTACFILPPGVKNQTPNACTKEGSIIQMVNQVVGEKIPVIGTSFDLVYFSDKVIGRTADYTYNIPITFSTYSNAVTGYNLQIKNEADVVLTNINYSPASNINYTHEWNGLDSNSNETWGRARRIVTITETATDFTMPAVTSTIYLGNLKAKKLGIGAWLPSIWHFYDSNSQTLYDGDGNNRQVTGVASAEMIRVPDKLGQEVYYFDNSGKIIQTKTGITGTTIYTFNYDSNERLISITQPFNKTTTFVRNSSGILQKIIAPNGAETVVNFDVNGYLSEIINPKSESYLMSYYGLGGLINTFTDPSGNVATFTYDLEGNLLSDTNSNGTSLTLSKTNGKVFATTALGRVTKSTYAGYSGQEILESPNGLMTFYTNNKNGYTESSSLGTSYTIFITHPRFGVQAQSLASRTDANFGLRGTSYSSVANLSDVNNPFSINSITNTETTSTSTHNSVYNGLTRTTTFTSDLGKTRLLQVDQYERPILTKIGNLISKTFSYNNDLLTNISEGTRTNELGYNSQGLLESITNSLNQTTSFTYDAAQRLSSTTLPDSRTITYTYDYNGNLTKILPPIKTQFGTTLLEAIDHNLVHGSNSKLSLYVPPTVPGIANLTTSYSYNNDKQLTKITRPDLKEINFNYNAATGLMTSITGAFGTITKNYSYGLVSSISGLSSDSLSILYTNKTPSTLNYTKSGTSISSYVRTPHTSRGIISSETIKGMGASSVHRTLNYTYNDDEYLTSAGDLTLAYNTPNGQLTGTTLGSITDTYTYNGFGEVEIYQANHGTTVLYEYSLTRDAIGRVSQKVETLNSITTTFDYEYDAAGRLIEVSTNGLLTSTYSYDENSNRIGGIIREETTTASYDQQDRLTTYNGVALTYNANGEILTKGTETFDYDVFGNLKQYVNGATTLTYEIDPAQRRLGKIVNGTLNQRYMYNPEGRLIGQLNSTNQLVKTFVYGSKGHMPDYYIDSANNKFRIITDYLGSVRLVVNSAGVVQQIMEHDEFGRVLQDTNPGLVPFGFAGGIYDSQSGLVRFGARDYDSQSGRWTTKDPIKFSGGDTNLYGYVFSDPVNFKDSNGLSADDVRKINGTFHNTVSEMTSSGKRTSPGFWNNMNKTAWDASGGKIGNNYQGCIDQASTMQSALGSQSYDDVWSFTQVGSDAPHLEPQSSLMFNLLPHWWLEGRSSNPNDPVLLIDPYNNIIKVK